MNNCCICLESTKNNNFIKCNTCANTIVCINCFNVLKSNNNNDRCPVCRTTPWYYNDNTVIIIYETQHPVLEPIEVNREQTNNTCICTYLCSYLCRRFSTCISYVKLVINDILQKIKPCFIIFAKFVVWSIFIWCFGFICTCILLLMFYNKFDYIYYIEYPHVFIMTYIIGFLLLASCYSCKKCIYNTDSS